MTTRSIVHDTVAIERLLAGVEPVGVFEGWAEAPRDLWTMATAAGSLAAVGALAGWMPAYRASQIDPARVLRGA